MLTEYETKGIIDALDTNLKINCLFTATTTTTTTASVTTLTTSTTITGILSTTQTTTNTTTTLELVVKTNCGVAYAGTNEGLLFTFCNGDQCCSTDEIKISGDCTTPDVLGSSKTGACKDFDFESESLVTGNVTYYNLDGDHDGWWGQWVKLILHNGKKENWKGIIVSE